MNINAAFPSKWLRAADVPDGADLALTITTVVMEEIGGEGDKEQKPVVYFSETDKGLLLNKTNAATISQLYTPETSAWVGKRIAIFSTEVEFAGKVTLGLRVRIRPPQGVGAPPSASTKVPPVPPQGLAADPATISARVKFLQGTPVNAANMDVLRTAVKQWAQEYEIDMTGITSLVAAVKHVQAVLEMLDTSAGSGEESYPF